MKRKLKHKSSPDYFLCITCNHERVMPGRKSLGYNNCLTCGDRCARSVTHTINPLHAQK